MSQITCHRGNLNHDKELSRDQGKEFKNRRMLVNKYRKSQNISLDFKTIEQNNFQVRIRCKDLEAKMQNGVHRMIARCETSGKWTKAPRSCNGMPECAFELASN